MLNISVHPSSPEISPASFELFISVISLPMLMLMLMLMLLYCGSATVESRVREGGKEESGEIFYGSKTSKPKRV
jgi:hypothetical protein